MTNPNSLRSTHKKNRYPEVWIFERTFVSSNHVKTPLNHHKGHIYSTFLSNHWFTSQLCGKLWTPLLVCSLSDALKQLDGMFFFRWRLIFRSFGWLGTFLTYSFSHNHGSVENGGIWKVTIYFWRYTHFSLNHDYGRKGTTQTHFPQNIHPRNLT